MRKTDMRRGGNLTSHAQKYLEISTIMTTTHYCLAVKRRVKKETGTGARTAALLRPLTLNEIFLFITKMRTKTEQIKSILL